MLYYIKAGGNLMWVLLVLSVVALAVILERSAFFLFREKKGAKGFGDGILMALASEDKENAIKLCRLEKNTVGISVERFLIRCKRGADFHHYDQLIKQIELDEIGKLEKRLHLLAMIGHVAPMIGLLGTVTGMIKAFTNLSRFGAGDANVVAGGISEALLTTAGGLFIAIPAIIVYNLLSRKIEETEEEIDKIITNIIEVMRS
jgi:biopolymer transport protein ExbB